MELSGGKQRYKKVKVLCFLNLDRNENSKEFCKQS